MTHRFLFMMLLMTGVAVAASAQKQEPVMTRSQLKPFAKIPPVILPVRPLADTATSNRSLVNGTYIKNWYHESVLIDTISMGKVYRMAVDNMLCLVPDDAKTARMPVKKIKVPEQMPNAYWRRNEQGRR